METHPVKPIFLTHSLWHALWSSRDSDLSLAKRFAFRLLKLSYIAVYAPFNRELINHASALSYKFVLSLIPMLAMIFSIAKGFGIQDKVEPLLMEKMVGGEIASDLIPKILEYVNNTNVSALGSIGLFFIVYTAISMLGQIEASFNQIWSVSQPRTLIRKSSDYLSILIIGPILIAVTLGLSTTLQSNSITQKLLEIGLFAGAMKLFLLSIPWASSILIMTLLYIIIPNTTVRIVPALIAGVVTGCCWQITQIFFINFQIIIAKYNAIYGTFATVPIFMIWLHTSWVIVLFGGVLNFACQHVAQFHPLEFAGHINFAGREKMSLAVLLSICHSFNSEEKGQSSQTISDRLGISDKLVQSATRGLLTMGYILEVPTESKTLYVPAKPSEQIKISDFFTDIKGVENTQLIFQDENINKALFQIETQMKIGVENNFKNQTIGTCLLPSKAFAPGVATRNDLP